MGDGGRKVSVGIARLSVGERLLEGVRSNCGVRYGGRKWSDRERDEQWGVGGGREGDIDRDRERDRDRDTEDREQREWSGGRKEVGAGCEG